MNILSKRIAVGLLSGVVLLAGSTAAYTVQAASQEGQQVSAVHNQKPPKPPKMDADKAAQHLADTFGVSKDEVLSYVKSNGRDFRDAFHGAELAKLNGKSFNDVMALKTSDNKWSDVASSLGVTKEQMQTFKQQMMAQRLAKDGDVSESLAGQLLQQGYQPQDIHAAGVLAKASGKDVQSVLGMKKINNSWKDVAGSLKVDTSALKQDKKHGMPPQGDFDGEHKGAPQDMDQQAPPADAPQADGEQTGE